MCFFLKKLVRNVGFEILAESEMGKAAEAFSAFLFYLWGLAGESLDRGARGGPDQ